MPQVSNKFGPIYASTTLDGSGNGQVNFQAQGSNVRITNLFVKAATTTNQAIATMYKGYVADTNIVSNTNSGSTGAAAHGAIDLFDGETCIVVWRGGDPGAQATATFIGVKLPFDVQPTSLELSWDDPIAAGDGSLIYPALKSPNFDSGVMGWQISRDGDAEFNDVDIRGTFTASGADDSYVVISSGPFAIIRFRPPNYSFIPPGGNITEGYIWSTSDGNNVTNAQVVTAIKGAGFSGSVPTNHSPFINLISPTYDGVTVAFPTVQMRADNGGVDFLCEVDGHFHTGSIAVDSTADIGSPTSNTTIPGYMFHPCVYVDMVGANVPTGSVVNITPSVAIRNNWGMWTPGNDFFTIQRTGIYDLGVCYRYASQIATSGIRQARISVNGADYMYNTFITTTAMNNTNTTVEIIINGRPFNAGDVIRFPTFQNSGAPLALTANSCAWIRAVQE